MVREGVEERRGAGDEGKGERKGEGEGATKQCLATVSYTLRFSSDDMTEHHLTSEHVRHVKSMHGQVARRRTKKLVERR